MKCFLVIRADKENKNKQAIHELKENGVQLERDPKVLDPEKADNILVNILDTKLEKPCEAASVVAIRNRPGKAIAAIKEGRPPAHVIVVSDRYSIYDELKGKYEELESMELN